MTTTEYEIHEKPYTKLAHVSTLNTNQNQYGYKNQNALMNTFKTVKKNKNMQEEQEALKELEKKLVDRIKQKTEEYDNLKEKDDFSELAKRKSFIDRDKEKLVQVKLQLSVMEGSSSHMENGKKLEEDIKFTIDSHQEKLDALEEEHKKELEEIRKQHDEKVTEFEKKLQEELDNLPKTKEEIALEEKLADSKKNENWAEAKRITALLKHTQKSNELYYQKRKKRNEDQVVQLRKQLEFDYEREYQTRIDKYYEVRKDYKAKIANNSKMLAKHYMAHTLDNKQTKTN